MSQLKQGALAPAALSVLLCFCVGCASAGRQGPADAARARRPQSVGGAERQLTLSAKEVQRTEAISQYATGVSLEATGGLESALPSYRRSLELDPQNVALAIRLANYYLSRKDTTNAVAVLESATRATPNATEAWLWLGIAHRAAGQIAMAITALRQALKLSPTHLGAVQALAEIHVQDDSLTEAARLLDQAKAARSDDPYYWTRLGDLYAFILKQKPALARLVDRAEIENCYKKALAISADEPEILMRLGDEYAVNNDLKQAADVYARVLALRPDLPNIWEKLIRSYVLTDQKDKVAALLEEIIKRNPFRHEVYNYLGDLYEELGQDDRALSNYEQSLAVKSAQLGPRLRIASLHMKQKKYDEAFATLDQARKEFPTAYEVPYLSAIVRTDKKEYAEAVASFAEAESLAAASKEEGKPDARFYFHYGAACERAGDLDKAAVLFRRSIELNPEMHAAYNYLGYMWADKSIHLEEALQLINKAIALEPDNGAYLDSLGWVLYRLGRYNDALPHLQRAVELVTDDAVVFDHLAELLLKLGRRDEAIKYLRRAREMEPDNKDIAQKLQDLTGQPTSPR
jgi:tetratricopeptide (TPR) repeat protein